MILLYFEQDTLITVYLLYFLTISLSYHYS